MRQSSVPIGTPSRPGTTKASTYSQRMLRQIIGSVCSCEMQRTENHQSRRDGRRDRVEPDAEHGQRGAESGQPIDQAAGHGADKHQSDLL